MYHNPCLNLKMWNQFSLEKFECSKKDYSYALDEDRFCSTSCFGSRQLTKAGRTGVEKVFEMFDEDKDSFLNITELWKLSNLTSDPTKPTEQTFINITKIFKQ